MVFGSRLDDELLAAHLSFTPGEYLHSAGRSLCTSAALFLGIAAVAAVAGSSFPPYAFIPPILFWLLLFCAMVPGVFLYYALTPSLIARGRKSRIDLDLPYVVSYMQALSTTMTPYAMIRRVYEEDAMFSEVSHEFGQVVRDVELFGDDMITALHALEKTTPSVLMKNLANDLCIVFESGGDVTAYLSAKTGFFHEQARRELDVVLKTIEIMAEVYVSAFVAGPIALIIMIVAQGMASRGTMAWLLPFMYICIPAGALAMIWILSLMLPEEDLGVRSHEAAEPELHTGIAIRQDGRPPDPAFLRKIEAKKRRQQAADRLRHPLRTYMSRYEYGMIAGAICAGIFALLLAYGALSAVFPQNTTEAGVCLIIAAFIAPVSLAYEVRRRYVNDIEEHVPEFLRELSDMKDIGLTLPDAIGRISAAKLGVLSSELSLVTRDVHTGSYVNMALVRMEERIGLVSVKRAISLLTKAGEITTSLRQIFIIAIADFEHYLKMKRERANTTLVYVMIIYLSFGIYLYTAYQLNGPFMSSFSTFNIGYSISQNVTDMFRIGIILGLFSGIMAGQFSSNSILAGFKHSIVLLAAAIVMFVFVI